MKKEKIINLIHLLLAQEGQPDFINKLFDIDGVKSIFYVMDFISVDKEDNADWNNILPQIQSTFE